MSYIVIIMSFTAISPSIGQTMIWDRDSLKLVRRPIGLNLTNSKEHNLLRHGLEAWQTSKLQNRRPLFDAVPHRAQILCLNFIKYYSCWLHVSSQLSLLDDYLIIRTYNELNHRDCAQININSDKNITQ